MTMSAHGRHVLLMSWVLVAVSAGACATSPDPVSIDSRNVVETLASDDMEGRLTGTEGTERAAEYIVSHLTQIGATPLPGAADYRLPFQFTAGVNDSGSRVSVTGSAIAATSWSGDVVRALSLSDTGTVSGDLVFAGYGLVVPETDGFSYDSYATLDVEGKIALVLRYFPEETEGELRGTLSRYAGLRYKAMAARQRGASGLIVVTGPRSPNAGALVPMTFDTAISGSRIHAVSVTGDVGEVLIGLTGQTLDEVQASLDTGNPHVTGFDIPDVEATLETSIEREQRAGRNVVGLLPGSASDGLEKPYILLGAHFDHLGRGTGGNSLAREGEAGEVHNGADDNASGVAAVLLAANELATVTRRRGVILAFWSGEELGLLGSADFVKSSPVPTDQIAAYLNFDMVGRLTEERLSVQAVGTSPMWTELVQELNEPLALDLQFVEDPYLPTDVMSLNQAEVPSLGFFTGSHEDYHRPSDDPETLNYEGLGRVASLGAAVADRLANADAPPKFVRVERVAQQGSQAVMRIYTGTIPDYSQEAEGLLLSGVVGGGPAELAGLEGGDVIVELAGQSIANIYDYTYALDLLRVGQPASVVFVRDGERIEAELVPRAREQRD